MTRALELLTITPGSRLQETPMNKTVQSEGMPHTEENGAKTNHETGKHQNPVPWEKIG